MSHQPIPNLAQIKNMTAVELMLYFEGQLSLSDLPPVEPRTYWWQWRKRSAYRRRLWRWFELRSLREGPLPHAG